MKVIRNLDSFFFWGVVSFFSSFSLLVSASMIGDLRLHHCQHNPWPTTLEVFKFSMLRLDFVTRGFRKSPPSSI